MVDARVVTNAGATAGYLAKYVTKWMYTDELQKMGYARRWSRSRSWPGKGVVQLKGSIDGQLKPLYFNYKNGATSSMAEYYQILTENHPLAERIGDDGVSEVIAKGRRRVLIKQIERLVRS